MEVKNSNVDGSESSSDSERQIDVITRYESGENNYPDTHINRTKSLSSSGRRSSSSSSSESSSDDLFNALKFTASDASELASKSEKNYASSSESSAKSEVDNGLPVPTSTYQVYNVAYNQKGMSPTISPPIQVMDRSGRYDPARIPSSIFERNNNNDWSIASNDSLFSIHIGHNSFSRDAFKFSEPRISEELTKPVELNMLNRIPSVTIEEVESSRKSDDIESLQTSEESFKFKPNLSEDQNDVRTFHQAARSMSTKSSVTTTSLQSGSIRHSFVPLKKRSRRWWYCCNCSWAFCHHKRSTCCHTWPSCKCSCAWLFCGCCNSDRSFPILTETDGNSFMKQDISRQHSHKEECDFCSNLSRNCCNWFNCFSCPSCTCKLSCIKCKCCC